MSKFPDRLKELRKKRELLGKDLAKIMRVEPAAITNWEKGNRFPKDDALIKIADYFDCSLDYLHLNPITPTGFLGNKTSDSGMKNLSFNSFTILLISKSLLKSIISTNSSKSKPSKKSVVTL